MRTWGEPRRTPRVALSSTPRVLRVPLEYPSVYSQYPVRVLRVPLSSTPRVLRVPLEYPCTQSTLCVPQEAETEHVRSYYTVANEAPPSTPECPIVALEYPGV